MPRFREPSTREINWVASAVATVARLLTALAACKQMQATLCPAWPGPLVPNVQGHTRARTRRACSEGPENERRARKWGQACVRRVRYALVQGRVQDAK